MLTDEAGPAVWLWQLERLQTLQSIGFSHCSRMLQVRRYMPYGSGSRECLGMPQARVTMLATLAVMLSRFSFCLADKVIHPALIFAQTSAHAHKAGLQSMYTK